MTAEKLAELNSAEQEFSAVTVRETGVVTTRQKLTSARNAEQLLDQERTVRERGKEYAGAVADRTNRKRERGDAEQAESRARERLATENGRRDEREGAGRELQRLSDLRDRVEKIALAAGAVAAAETQHRNENADHGRLDQEVHELTQTIEQREQRMGTLQAAAQRVDFLSLTAQQLTQSLQNRRRLDVANEELATERERFDQSNTAASRKDAELQEVREKFDQMQTDWLSGQAAILAAGLEPGAQCQDCGSV